MRRLVLAVTLIPLGLASALAATLLGQQKPSFRSGVEVVLLDVNVVDRSHTPVDDLQPDDFIVSVDRKPRKVVSAQFLRYDVRTSTTKERQRATVPGGSASPEAAADRPPARNVLIVIDNDSMEPGDGMVVRQGAEKFIDQLAPDDRIGVVTIPRLQSVVTMTKVRDDVRASLATVITGSDRYRSMQFNIGVAEAFAIERNEPGMAEKVIRRECKGGDPSCPIDVMMEVRQIQVQTHNRGDLSLTALRDLGDSLRRIAGPKTLLYVTGGAPPPDLRSGTAYSRIETAFAAAQITLYTLYVHQDLYGQAARHGAVSPTQDADMAIEREGVENATGAAGGTFMDAVGTFDQYFDRMVTEMSGAYLLGIEVQAADRDGKAHQVSVKVNRKAVDVRARKQYVIDPARGPASGASALPVGVSATVARPPAPVAPDNPAARMDATPAGLQPLIERVGQYVQAYEAAFLALLSEERSELTVSKWQARAGTGAWAVESRRRLAGDNLLVKRPGTAGWTALRDVFELDGQPLRQRDGRLRALFLEAPDTIIERAAAMNAASTAHDIGFVNRSTNVVTGPLVFLDAGNRGHFVFATQGEQVVAGIPAWQIAFAEHDAPIFARSASGPVPISGALWADPKDGTILKTLARWEADGTTAEVTVTYGRTNDGTMWVPADMTETYVAGASRLDCITKFFNYRKFEGGDLH